MVPIKKDESSESNLLLPSIIDHRAQTEPDRLYCAIFKSTDIKDGLNEISYSDFANAINKCAWWLEKTLGKDEYNSNTDLKTIAYIGPPDIRQGIVALAVAKTNRQTLLLSPRNSPQGLLNLLDKCKCDILLTSQDFPALNPLISTLASKRELQVNAVESVEHWIGQPKVPIYEFHATLEKDASRTFVILHTSGSTGYPEPCAQKFGSLAAYRRYLHAEEIIKGVSKPTMAEFWKNKVTHIAFPTFHMVGFLCLTAVNIHWNMPPIIAPPTIPSTPQLAASIFRHPLCESTVLPVSILEPIAKDPTLLSSVAQLKLLMWCGSGLSSPSIATSLMPLTNIMSAYGATETGPFITQVEDQEDYEYMSFSPIMGVEFIPYSSSGPSSSSSSSSSSEEQEDLYELTIQRKPELEGLQSVFFTFPHLRTWHSKDLFSPHPNPSKAAQGLWKYRGRTDDMIILSNGSNINPSLMEGVMMKHPNVVAALLTGNGRDETAWLVEVKSPPIEGDEEDEERLKVELRDSLLEANAMCHVRDGGRTRRDMVVLVKKGKLMLRAAKGTVQRKATVLAYKEELDALYGKHA